MAKSFEAARSEHNARGRKMLSKSGYEHGASTERREDCPPAKYARGGGVKGKGGNRTQINILMPHHPPGAGVPAGPGAGLPVGPKPPMMAPPSGPPAGPGLGGPPPIGPGAKRGGRVGR